MFSEGLRHSLDFGATWLKKEYLSFRDLGETTYAHIDRLNKREKIIPEVHTAIMPTGDIADIPLFRNAAYPAKGLEATYNIELRKRSVQSSILQNTVSLTIKLFIGYMHDVDKAGKYDSDRLNIISKFDVLERMKPSRQKEVDFKAYQLSRASLYDRIMSIMDDISPSVSDRYRLDLACPGFYEIYSEARQLMDRFLSDPIYCFHEVLEFCGKYSKDTQTHREVVLLGSLITDLAHCDVNTLMINDKRTVVRKGLSLIRQMLLAVEQLLLQRQNQSVDELVDLQKGDYYLPQQTEDRAVLRCWRLERKISASFSLRDISLELKLGEITGLVGENGNGKSSLLSLLAGEVRALHGNIEYPLLARKDKNWATIKRSIGYVRQPIPAWNNHTTVEQELQFTAAMVGMLGKENDRQFDFIIARLGLEKCRRKRWTELSKGYQLRCEIARQLIAKPRLLLLDEPLANLDISSKLHFLNDLRSITNSISHSMAVIISSQHVYEVEKVADHILYMKAGRVEFIGKLSDICDPVDTRCFEVDVEENSLEIQKALEILNVKEIQNDSFYYLIHVDADVTSNQVLNAFANAGIQIRYFREVNHSTRKFFDK